MAVVHVRQCNDTDRSCHPEVLDSQTRLQGEAGGARAASRATAWGPMIRTASAAASSVLTPSLSHAHSTNADARRVDADWNRVIGCAGGEGGRRVEDGEATVESGNPEDPLNAAKPKPRRKPRNRAPKRWPSPLPFCQSN